VGWRTFYNLCHKNKRNQRANVKLGRFVSDHSPLLPSEQIIVNGHSLYFKHFFNTYLPASCSHPARTKKISNCGVVSFSIKKAMHNNNVMFRIDPTSIQVVCGRIA
jgi:hypothetical protein